MPQHPHRAGPAGALRRGPLAVGVVAALAGLMFATSATVFRASEDRHPQNLQELVRAENTRLTEANAEVEALRTEVEQLVDETSNAPASTLETSRDLAMAAGRVAVTGPGLVVRLWDAPTANAPVNARPDDLVVHQQDVEAVINALWGAGAEAMTIQGQRVSSMSAVRCVGNVLLLHGTTYSPPYEIAAIGNPDRLARGLDKSPGVQVYLEYVDAVRLGWSVAKRDTIEMPAHDGTLTMAYATVPDAATATATATDAATATQGSQP